MKKTGLDIFEIKSLTDSLAVIVATYLLSNNKENKKKRKFFRHIQIFSGYFCAMKLAKFTNFRGQRLEIHQSPLVMSLPVYKTYKMHFKGRGEMGFNQNVRRIRIHFYFKTKPLSKQERFRMNN